MLTTLAAWVQANCPAGVVQKVVLDQARSAELQRHDYHVAIGERLTKSGKPYLVQTYGGNLFVFALTEEQARGCGMSGFETSYCCDCQRPIIAAEPKLIIEGFEIADADRLNWLEPIRGRCRCSGEVPLLETFCLRIEMILRWADALDRTTRLGLFCYPWLRPGTATIEFQLSPIDSGERPSIYLTPQTAAVFLSVCTKPDARQGLEAQPISDALGALVTFR